MSRFISKVNISKLSVTKKAVKEAKEACLSASSNQPKINWPIKKYKIFFLWCAILLFMTVFLDSSMIKESGLRHYFKTLRWTPLPVGVGFALIAFQQYRHTRRRESIRFGELNPCDVLADEWEIQAYKLLPLRFISRTWGWVNSLELPEWSRNIVFGSYVKTFGCNMSEAEVEDLNKYKCLSEFFRRRLKINARPIHPTACVVSPADGTILYAGKVTCGMLEQIKGVSYSLKKFFGPKFWINDNNTLPNDSNEECVHSSLLKNPMKNDLYHVGIYLAPGDYHRFHSPADWSISFRRHFPGELLSVNPSIASWISDLFVLNERVCYFGTYKYGFFSMTAIGATNVGSIIVSFDESLKTNERMRKQTYLNQTFEKVINKKKGEDFGEFNLGSTIVLIFEAPKDLCLSLEAGQKVKVGQSVLRTPFSHS